MERCDLLVVGGGINGTAIAREAVGRGLSVMLVERDDLAQHTSSASSKLIHGGLRYLEQYDFGLVRELLREREVMLRTAPHIVRPLMFVLPDPPGGRPWWMIRLGLWTYDRLAGRSSLPRSQGVGQDRAHLGEPLHDGFRLATYWDAWVDDARLVVLNAVDAAERGARILTRTEFVSARREGETWLAELSEGRTVGARMIVNAAGPWVMEMLRGRLGAIDTASGVRLIKGSHIVVPRLWIGDHAYILQQPDGRVVFALPYGEHCLIGTTDVPVGRPEEARIYPEEIDYLCAAADLYFTKKTKASDVIWSYSGIRSLHDDGSAEAKDVTRDYRLELDGEPGPPLLSVFGGKITTARALALEAMDELGANGTSLTATSPLPGGEVAPGFDARLAALAEWMPKPLLGRLTAAYGSRLDRLLGPASSIGGLGRDFGAGLYEAEVRYLVEVEYARTADDILWRRSKLGLRMSLDEQRALTDFLDA